MSFPNIPDITPEINLERNDVINLLLASIAMEEISLSHFLNAESEKIQKFLHKKDICFRELMQLNQSVEKSMRNVIKNQMLLQFKLEDTLLLLHSKKHDHGFDYLEDYEGSDQDDSDRLEE